MESKLRFLLDRDVPFNDEKARVLDELTFALKNNTAQAKEANQVWRLLKEDHYFWYNADKVLSLCKIDQTKVFMLVLLEQAIKQKWLALPKEQRESFKNYIVDIILQYSAVDNLSKPLQNILSKCNSILIQIVKYQWNTTWTSFINDICSSAMKDMNICQNNFTILKMLSEEIFDHSKNQLTHQQIIELKNQMNTDFTTIFNLCEQILQNSHQVKQSLVRACLETLNAFLSWIPMYYIICSDMIDKLVLMFQSDYLRNDSLSCLVQIAALPIDPNEQQQRNKYLFMLQRVTEQLNKLIPLSNDDREVEQLLKSVRKKNRYIFEALARGIANFYSQFFKSQTAWLEKAVAGNQEGIRICQHGFRYLLMMMKIDEDQVFKITIDFFHFYIGNYLEQNLKENNFGGMSYHMKGPSLDQIYSDIFMEVMKMVCLKMAKPEEVLIVIDEDGIPVREQMENTENSSLYEIEKELGQFLVRYNWSEMKKFIINQIEKQHNTEYFSFDALNSLSWIVGSLCGSIQDREERSFFIATLRTLLQLCENKKGKENKAVIASCIMYVVGQYPTFLRNNWTFLRTVIKKLFEFMKEEYPGIMEMACNAFLKIAKSTSDQFTMIQPNEHQPYIRQIIRKIPDITRKLSHEAYHYNFYEAMGYLISAEPNADTQFDLMKQTLGSHLFDYFNLINMAQEDQHVFKNQQVTRKLNYFLKLNEMLATGVVMLSHINETMNKIYIYYSMEINSMVSQNGKNVLNFMTVKMMRLAKKEIIKVYTRMLEKCNDLTQEQANHILERFIFPLGELLNDFKECIPETKDQQFVALFTVVLEKLHMVLNSDFLTKLLEMIFTSSLPLITSDFNSFPEIRANFFGFLKALVKFNFGTLFSLDQNYFNTILDCVIWSLRHELSTHSDLGLDLLEEILTNVNKNMQVTNEFYARYHMRMLTQILDVMTDGFHKSGLRTQMKIFFILIHVTTQNMVTESIAQEKPAGQSNSEFLFNFLVEKLTMAFPNVVKSATCDRVGNWFKTTEEKQFEAEVEDYLVMINRYSVSQVNEK